MRPLFCAVCFLVGGTGIMLLSAFHPEIFFMAVRVLALAGISALTFFLVLKKIDCKEPAESKKPSEEGIQLGKPTKTVVQPIELEDLRLYLSDREDLPLITGNLTLGVKEVLKEIKPGKEMLVVKVFVEPVAKLSLGKEKQ